MIRFFFCAGWLRLNFSIEPPDKSLFSARFLCSIFFFKGRKKIRL